MQDLENASQINWATPGTKTSKSNPVGTIQGAKNIGRTSDEDAKIQKFISKIENLSRLGETFSQTAAVSAKKELQIAINELLHDLFQSGDNTLMMFKELANLYERAYVGLLIENFCFLGYSEQEEFIELSPSVFSLFGIIKNCSPKQVVFEKKYDQASILDHTKLLEFAQRFIQARGVPTHLTKALNRLKIIKQVLGKILSKEKMAFTSQDFQVEVI